MKKKIAKTKSTTTESPTIPSPPPNTPETEQSGLKIIRQPITVSFWSP